MQTEEELRLYGAGYQLAEQAARIAELEEAAIAVTFDGEIKAETRIACLRSALDLAGQALQARNREIARLHDLLGKLLAERVAAPKAPAAFPARALRHSR
jgi:hypothetical protein